MNIEQIKTAVREGKTVHWASDIYVVILHTFASGKEQWLVKCLPNDYCTGLTNSKGVMAENESDFFIALHTC